MFLDFFFLNINYFSQLFWPEKNEALYTHKVATNNNINNNVYMSYLLDILWVLPGDYLCEREIGEVKAMRRTPI